MLINYLKKSHSHYRAPIIRFPHYNSFSTWEKPNNNVVIIENKKSDLVALKKYIKIGKDLQENPTPFLNDLNAAIKDRRIFETITNVFPHLKKLDSSIVDTSYIALVSSRLIGKTQTAFAVNSKIPFYFVFNNIEHIYIPFYQLSYKLTNCAASDLFSMTAAMNERFAKSFIGAEKFKKISHVKSKVLGFLLALIEDAENFHSMDEEKRGDWLVHFARNRSFTFNDVSIDEFNNHPLSRTFKDKYFIFMDDFYPEDRLLLLRNLFAYLGITCAISTSNPHVINYFNVGENKWSQEGETKQLCLTFSQFPKLSASSIDQNFQLVNIENEKMCHFVEYLKDQCRTSRVGFAKLLMNEFRTMNKSGRIDFDDFFEKFLKNTRKQLIKIQPEIDDCSEAAAIANSYIMLFEIYHSEFGATARYRAEEFITDHFFRLWNPKRDGKPFLVCSGLNSKKKVYYANGSNIKSLRIRAYYNIKELFLTLTCLYGGLKVPVCDFIYDPLPDYNSFWDNSGDSFYQDRLEALAVLSICDSSHTTIRGTDFADFIERVLWNFNDSYKIFRFTFKNNDEQITNSLKKIKVPFLFPRDYKLPEAFVKMFPQGESYIHFGTYATKRPTIERIDGVFDLISDSETSLKKRQCIVHVKHSEFKLVESDLLRRVKNALAYSTRNPDTDFPLHLLFTSTFKQFNSNNKAAVELKNLAAEHKINFLTLKLLPEAKYSKPIIRAELVPLSAEGLPIHSDPERTTIVFDLHTLHKDMETWRKNNRSLFM